jgi:hypothetical protein
MATHSRAWAAVEDGGLRVLGRGLACLHGHRTKMDMAGGGFWTDGSGRV